MTGSPALSVDRRQRKAWREERDALGLRRGAPGFGRQGPMARLDGQSLQVVLLPGDPLESSVEFEESLARELPDRLDGAIARSVRLLGRDTTDSGHLLKVATGQANGGDEAYLSVARHGGVGVGIAERPGAYRLGAARVVRLSAVSGAVRLALKAQVATLRTLSDRSKWTPDGPWELSVALPGAQGSLLGAFAPGWREAGDLDDPPLCVEADPLVRLELLELPRDLRAQVFALQDVLARTVNAFGTMNPFYVDARNRTGGVPADY